MLKLKDGKVTKITPGFVVVELPDEEGIETYELPIPMRNTLANKHYHPYDVGEHVKILLDEEGEEGIILGAIYSEETQPIITDPDKYNITFSDGSSFEYDRHSHELSIKFSDQSVIKYNASAHKLNINVVAGGNIDISAAETTNINSKFINLNGSVAIGLNTPALSCLHPDGQLNMTEANFFGNLHITGNTLTTNMQNISSSGNISHNGSMNATGDIMNGGNNSNHHVHY